jgi:hypothetical protein
MHPACSVKLDNPVASRSDTASCNAGLCYVPALPLGVWDVRLQHDVTGAAGSRAVACGTCYGAGAPPSNGFVLRSRASHTVPLSIYRSYLWSI